MTSDSHRPPPASASPFVSVVIPARNEEACIETALRSVGAQRYPLDRIECIVVDNGSNDGTAQVVDRFKQDCQALAVSLEYEPIAGVARAKNRGAATARGEVLIFLDADSRMDPDLACEVAACFRAGTAVASIRIVADSYHPLDRGFFALLEVGKVLFGVRSQMLYCERSLFIALGGFDPNLHLAEDLEFLQRARSRFRASGAGDVSHLRTSAIRTSPRRLRTHPLHLGMIPVFLRWALAFRGIGRTRHY